MATTTTTPAAQSNEKILAAVATIPVVGLVMFFAMKDASPLVKNYAKQSNAVLAISIVGMIVGFLSIFVFLFGFLVAILDILAFVAWIMLVINAYGEKMYKLPVIGDFFDGLLK
jgi:uncharacterized membrane protein